MTINDMNTLLAAIEIAVKRGAFSVLEVGQVGDVATKLAAFLQSAKEQAEQAQAQTDQSGTETTDQEQPSTESAGA